MSYPKAIVIGAALMAGAIAFSAKAQANPNTKGRYRIASGHQKTAWRVDVETGQVVYCEFSNISLFVACYGPGKGKRIQ